jgi:hypothetical protein
MEPIQPIQLIQPPADNQEAPILEPGDRKNKANELQADIFADWFEEEDPELAVDEQDYEGGF